MGRLLVLIGLVIAGIGALMMLGIPFGRLPGDIVVRRGPVTFYLPIATCIILSVVLTVIVALFRR
ncbi:MAG TPA: DUF2905 domain-containing protein [Vicinamibacterales bacterium]|jgi:hypothetical protein